MPDCPNRSDDVQRVVELLDNGGVVAIPTDTVYGLAASLRHPRAIRRIFALKGRDYKQPLPVLVDDPRMLEELGVNIPDVARRLAERFWPGALTIIVEVAPGIPREILAGGSTVGLRMPDCPLALAVIRGTGGALAVTSANRSGCPEARTSAEVIEIFSNELDGVLDGGALTEQQPSSVIDVSTATPVLRREGAITRGELRAVTGELN